MDISLRNTQEKLEERVKQARKVGRKAFLVSTGLFGLTYDKVKSTLKDRKSLVEEAEQRGETMTREVGERVETLRQQANATVLDWRGTQSSATKRQKNAEVAQVEVEAAVAEMESDGGPPLEAAVPPATPTETISELAPSELLAGNEAITAGEASTKPTILIASASADLSELLAAEALPDNEEITDQAEATKPTILIAKD